MLGTAGSGKTTMAIHRAAYVANSKMDHGGPTLLVTLTLVTYLEHLRPRELANVGVRTYHHFPRGYLASRDGPDRPSAARYTRTLSASGKPLSGADVIAIVAAVVALAGAGFAYWQARTAARGEAWRRQPVVVVYESRAASVNERDEVATSEVFLVNEGPGTAFNIRFGVEIDDYYCSYAPKESNEAGKGELPRVLGSGLRAPEDDKRSYVIGFHRSQGGSNRNLDDRAYWCEYDNAFGESWQTRNWWRFEKGLEVQPLDRRRSGEPCPEVASPASPPT